MLLISSHARDSGTQNMMTENENIDKILDLCLDLYYICKITFGQTVYFYKTTTARTTRTQRKIKYVTIQGHFVRSIIKY